MSIPDELAVLILAHLNFRDILRSAQVCKRWKHIVEESLLLQYRIELGVAGRVPLDDALFSGPDELEPSYKARLDELAALNKASKGEHVPSSFKKDSGYRHLSYVLSSVTNKLVFSGCCACRTTTDGDPGRVHFIEQTRNCKIWAWSWVAPHLDSYTQFSISSSSGLFVGARADGTGERGPEIVIDILSLKTGKKHAETAQQSIKLFSCDRDGTTFINQVCLYADLCAIRLSSTYGSSFVSSIRVYNWKTNEPASVLLHSSPYYYKNKGLIFLSENAILTNSMQKHAGFVDATVEVYSLDKNSRHLATFHLPKLSRGGRLRANLIDSSSISDTNTTQGRGSTIADLANARLLGISVSGTEYSIDDMQQICTIVAPLSIFLNYKRFYSDRSPPDVALDRNGVVDIPWEAWGPKLARLIPVPCVSSATYGWKIAMADGIYDFNQVDIARDVQRFGAEHWLRHDRPRITTETTTFEHPSFVHIVKTSLPYRFIELDIPVGRSVILGERTIFWAPPPDESLSFLSESESEIY